LDDGTTSASSPSRAAPALVLDARRVGRSKVGKDGVVDLEEGLGFRRSAWVTTDRRGQRVRADGDRVQVRAPLKTGADGTSARSANADRQQFSAVIVGRLIVLGNPGNARPLSHPPHNIPVLLGVRHSTGKRFGSSTSFRSR
jgi:hypothetical protein